MANKSEYRSSSRKEQSCAAGLFNFVKDSYLERTSRPIYAIVFLLPFIIFYEVGTILLNTDLLNQTQVRVVAFVWLQNFLEYLGFGSKLAWVGPGLAVVVILIAQQLMSRKQWWVGFGDIWPMTAECVLLAVPLIVISLFLNSPAGWSAFGAQQVLAAQSQYLAVSSQGHELLANIVTGIGAGIYEELIFRLILIYALMILFQDVMRLDRNNSILLSIFISAALFSAHHHIIFMAGRFGIVMPFNWPEFGFRTIAGIYFAILFAIRGFGITAGTHAFYDIIATVINTAFFNSVD